MRMQWCLYNIALPSCILVTLIYWSVLFPEDGQPTSFIDVCLHAMNSVLIITEQYLNSIPTRLAHVYQPAIYAILYLIFASILWSQTGIVVYKYILDWDHPGITAASLCGICLYYFVAQFVIFVIFRAQQKCLVRQS